MPPQETGKQRAARIPLDYYKKPDRLGRWKRGLGVLALLLAVGWPLAALVRGHRAELDYSRGPVAAVHATWDANCNACHVPFSPISGDAAFHSSTDAVLSQRCTTCHAGAVHHRDQVPELACASCHREHRGRDASLVRIPDGHCTQCHGNLAAHLKSGAKTVFQNAVTRFDKDSHPQFSVEGADRKRVPLDKATDPGRLKFNHKVHLSPGMATKEGGNPALTLDKLPERFRKRYRQAGQKDQDLVKLDCASCHRLDSGDFGIKEGQLDGLPADAVLPKRNGGGYMLPVVYENQCQACHPLTFERKDRDDPPSGHVAVPHRLQPKDLRDFLEGHYTGQILRGKFKLLDQEVPKRPLPGKSPLTGQETEKVRKVIGDKVDVALKGLLLGKKTCGECHVFGNAKGEETGLPAKLSDVADLRVLRPSVPDVWFKHAVFNHVAHRAVNCKDCHAGAYPDGKNASVSSKDVLIPGIDNCVQCHGPQRVKDGVTHGGARSDCVECHRYHNGNHALQGIGAAARGVPEAQRLDLRQFLSGGAKR